MGCSDLSVRWVTMGRRKDPTTSGMKLKSVAISESVDTEDDITD